MPVWGVILCFPFAFFLISISLPALIYLIHLREAGFLRGFHHFFLWFLDILLKQEHPIHLMWMSPTEFSIIQIWLMFCGIITPTIFFGAFVYKIVFVSEPFVFRKKVSLYQDIKDTSQSILSIRLYNALSVPIADVRFRIFARIPYRAKDDTNCVRNLELNLMDETRKTWPISFPFVPYTLEIPVSCSCRHIPEYGIQKFACMPGFKIDENEIPVELFFEPESSTDALPTAHLELVVFVEGRAPWFGINANQFKIFQISENDISYGYPQSIDMTNYRKSPSAWKGWDNFENSSEEVRNWKWVFGYGSLVDLDSLKRTLGKDKICLQEYIYCSLKGFIRKWNVAMDNTQKIQGYKYYVDNRGEQPPVGVTFLNIVKTDSDRSVNGILFRVNAQELERLKERERNYEAVEMDSVDLDVDLPCAKIIVFLANRDGKDRFDRFNSVGKAVISKDYRDQVENAFKQTGLKENYYDRYVNSTIAPDIHVMELKRIDFS